MTTPLSTTPSFLPKRLTITLWDFTWYTQTMPGEPFHNLDDAFVEAKDRGYNTVRICAAPLLLFGKHSIDTTQLHFVNMGGQTGQRTRWYDSAGGAVLSGREHLLALFRAAKAHDMFVIVSSWEYQQSPAFLADPSWHEMVRAIAPIDRHSALAAAEAALVSYLKEAGLGDRIAYVEIHNEVDLSRLDQVPSDGMDTFWAQKPYLESALELLQHAHPDVLSTVCYGIPPYLDLDSIPSNAQVVHMHLYIYGVLSALEEWAQVRAAPPVFPTAELTTLLRDDAPDFSEWNAAIEPWRLEATGISTSMFYAYDWVDPVKWDAWLDRVHAPRGGLRGRPNWSVSGSACGRAVPRARLLGHPRRVQFGAAPPRMEKYCAPTTAEPHVYQLLTTAITFFLTSTTFPTIGNCHVRP